MTIEQKYLHINNITWHCFSVFYAKENIIVLLNTISTFYEINKKYLTHLSLYFSELQGERINLVIISKGHHSRTLVACIEQYFKRFLKENPSESLHSIPYGSVIWKSYPNNYLLWNGFQIPSFLLISKKNRDFSQATSLLITNLYDSESSYNDNLISIAGFLSVQLLKHQNIALPTITNQEISETIQSYWDWEDEDLLSAWKKHADIKIGISIICSQMNLPENFFDMLLTTK